MPRKLDGQVAVVTGGGHGPGRAAALALGARGVRVVVFGEDERALGETVGELAYGGAKARHVVGDASDPSHVARAVDRALEVFGALDIAVATTNVSCTFRAAVARMNGPGRLLAIAGEDDGDLLALASATARDLAPRGIACNAIAIARGAEPHDEDDADERAARLAVLLCSPEAEGITGQRFVLGPPLARLP